MQVFYEFISRQSKSNHTCTIGTLEDLLVFSGIRLQGPCSGMGLEVKIQNTLNGTATLMISMFYMKELSETWILIPNFI